MYCAESIDVGYLTLDQLTECRGQNLRNILAVVQFSATGGGAVALPDVRTVEVMMPPLGDEPTAFEVWRAPGPLQSGQTGLVRHRSNASLLFGCVVIAEADAPIAGGGRTALEAATECAYEELFRCVDARGFPHLWRIWNYLPDINGDAFGMERYQQFNSARRRAFLQARRDIARNVPAACALGSAPGSPLSVYFLASNRPGTPIENPRQVSAYEYPPQYGRASPTFSRAIVSPGPARAVLLVSGTASILGHRTVHEGDVLAQTRESIANVRALVEAANRKTGAQDFAVDELGFKVYLRRAADLPACAAELRRTLGSATPIVYLRADICRSDLLVEIEAVGGARRTP